MHQPPPPSLPVLPSPGQELFTSLSAVLSQSRDPINIHRPQIPPLISPQLSKKKKKTLPVFPAAHTYINTSLWRQRCWGRRGLGIKITLNSKQRIVGPWQVDGLSASCTCFRITPQWHVNHQTGRAALGDGSWCVSQVPAVHRIWSGEVWYGNSELVGDTVGAGGAYTGFLSIWKAVFLFNTRILTIWRAGCCS